MTTTRTLFGGALIAAGMLAPAAHGQNFINAYTVFSTVAAYDVPYHNQYSTYAFSGPGFFSIAATVDGSAGFAAVQPNYIANATLSLGQNMFGGALSFGAYFMVDANTLAGVDWDFSADEGAGGMFIDSFLSIDDLTTGTNVFFTDLSNPVGSTQVSLDSTHQYVLNGTSISFDGAGLSFWNVSVPTPGSAGLLGLAGLVAARRRR